MTHPTIKFEDVDADTLAIEHFEDMRQELEMNSVWRIWEAAPMKADDRILKNYKYRVVYDYVCSSDDDDPTGACEQVQAIAESGSIEDLWIAAESCIDQSGTSHSLIKDFEMQDDGSLCLVTGS